ncbi:hypothetical protein LX90_003749 [Lentzea flava]|nr:hypothetical protein [Lentzea flava]
MCRLRQGQAVRERVDVSFQYVGYFKITTLRPLPFLLIKKSMRAA